MKITFGKNKLKAMALVLCAVITAGSLTCVNYGKPVIKTEAKTISDIENEKAENQAEIDELQRELDSLKDDVAEQEAYQTQLQEKIDLQNKNIDNVNTIINDLNNKIEEKENKIDQLEKDIAQKQVDIDEGLELFKARLRAMYISGNDSLASALVGATDFYDMLSKIEFISQVAKHDDELIESLKTQLEQFEEAQAQLDIEKAELAADLQTQEDNRKELNAAIEQLQADYAESDDYIKRKEADMASRQRDIDSLEADNAAMDAEMEEIEAEIERQRQAAEAAAAAAAEEDDDDDYYSDDSYSDSGSSGSGYVPETSADENYGGSLSWPVPGFYGISSGYGYRWGSLHAGIDIAGGGISGATITAADSGTVVLVKTGCSHNYGKDGSCGCNGGYGNYIVIDHGNGISTLYGHCADVYVSVGQSVSRGEAIGSVGSTGYSTGFHLHFEVRVGGSTVDPTSYLY
ncbi:MAG: murein hydrolase activator EnvC family protein [Porcipelethomonas sp.]